MLPLIEQHRGELIQLCQKYGVRRLYIFGSRTRADFDPARSDLDLLVDLGNLDTPGAADRYFGLIAELEALFGCRVDLVTTTGVENPFFREVLRRTRVPLYAA